MKFIRNWIKKIIKETLIENFPATNITVTPIEDRKNFLSLKGGTFVNSSIKIGKEDALDMENCFIKQDQKRENL